MEKGSLKAGSNLISRGKDKILLIRGQKVMLDSDLAFLYGVETKLLIQAVKRNKERFPVEFMFQLTLKEFENLRSQIVTSSWGGRRYAPFAFTEYGVVMLSGVLKSKKAIAININIVKAFIRLRELAFSYKDLARKLWELEDKYGRHDKKIAELFVVLRQLSSGDDRKKHKRIGF